MSTEVHQSRYEMDSLPDLTMDTSMDAVPGDFNDLFNFDEYEGGESSTHSPLTMTNQTPSPLIQSSGGLSPFLMPDNYDLDAENIEFDYGFMGKPKDQMVKQEPVAYIPQPPPQPEVQPPAPTNFDSISYDGLPVDQQLALQQLMKNIVSYQKLFGLENLPQPAQNAPTPTTIQPSMVFSTSPSQASHPSTSFVSPAPILPQAAPQLFLPDMQEEPLVAVSPQVAALPPVVTPNSVAGPSRSERQPSTFSSLGDDLDLKLDRLVPLPEIFGAGKGKGGKKGGGMSSVVRGSDEELDDDDSWRPSPEEYKKLSSKEKRQLRNKLSARAFRTRRKDYIGTLESHIKDRDTVIDAIKSELTTSRSENLDLKRELEALKASTMKVLHPPSANVSSAPAVLNTLAMPLPTPPLPSPRKTTPSFPINVRKDLPATTSYDNSRGFWGGSDNNLFGGGHTVCHTLFTPDFTLPSESASSQTYVDHPRVNLNPRLNDPTPSTSETSLNAYSLANVPNARDLDNASFAEWAETNPFSFRSMDSYRIQVWSRLAREAAGEKSHTPSDLRPKFYVEADKSRSAASTPAPALKATSTSVPASPTPTSTANPSVLSGAGQLGSKLAASFLSAFQNPTSELTAVVTGKSKSTRSRTSSGKQQEEFNEKTGLPSSRSTSPKLSDQADYLVSALGNLKLQTGSADGAAKGRERENPLRSMSGFLKHSIPTRV